MRWDDLQDGWPTLRGEQPICIEHLTLNYLRYVVLLGTQPREEGSIIEDFAI
jgi:hypothetical protein